MTKTCSPHIKKISKKADTQPQPPDSEGKSRLTKRIGYKPRASSTAFCDTIELAITKPNH
jgi:hypothetical protein